MKNKIGEIGYIRKNYKGLFEGERVEIVDRIKRGRTTYVFVVGIAGVVVGPLSCKLLRKRP